MNILNEDLGAVKLRSLTPEQKSVVDLSLAPGELAKVIAYAGTGKTSTFIEYANARPSELMTYLAFNKSVETEAKAKFGGNVTPKTVHALAYANVGYRYARIIGNVQNWQVAKALSVSIYEATLIARTLESFLNSDSDLITELHAEVDVLDRLRPGYQAGLVQAAGTVWSLMQREMNDFKMTHSGYLKLYQLSRPLIPGSTILLDEAQDTNPVTLALVLHQRTAGKRILLCGDPYQQIYSWRGAVDAMDKVEGVELRLTQSFRFGPEVARVANCLLRGFFGEEVSLRGHDATHSSLGSAPTPRTILTRTNSEIFRSALGLALHNTPFHVIGVQQFSQLLDSVLDVFYLYRRQKDRIQERRIAFFRSFVELKEHAESTLDLELMMKARIIEDYGDAIPDYVDRIRKMNQPLPAGVETVFCTCHKAKGLEWDHVVLADDFQELFYEDHEGQRHLRKVVPATEKEKDDESTISSEEVNLLYVAATRARKILQLNRELQQLINKSAIE